MKEVSRPPVRMKSSTRRPISLSARAVTIAARSPKARRRPRATLYSPPPSQARKDRAVRMRPSPGSSRSITSPRDTASKRHSDTGRMLRSAIVIVLRVVSGSERSRRSSAGRRGQRAYQTDGFGRQCLDAREVAGLHEVTWHHPRATDGGDGRDGQVLRKVLGADSASGDEADTAERGSERADRGGATGGAGREELHGGDAELESGLDLGRGDRARKRKHTFVLTAFDDGPGQARRDHETGTGRHSLVHLGDGEHGARADEDVAPGGHRADGL